MNDKKPPKKKAPTFTMKAVKSSSLKAHGYDPESRTLAVEFQGGSVYHFADVSPETVKELEGAKSPGGFFAASIRDKFKGAKQ